MLLFHGTFAICSLNKSRTFTPVEESQPSSELRFYGFVFSLSGVEQADTVFSVEQTRTQLKPEKLSVTVAMMEEDELSSSSSSELFHKLKDNPEDLLQLAPAAGDAVIPLTGGALMHAICVMKVQSCNTLKV